MLFQLRGFLSYQRERTHKRYLNLLSSNNYNLFIFARNQTKRIFRLTKNPSLIENLNILLTLKGFWHLAYILNNFSSSFSPLIIHSHICLKKLILFLNLNSGLFWAHSSYYVLLCFTIPITLKFFISTVSLSLAVALKKFIL